MPTCFGDSDARCRPCADKAAFQSLKKSHDLLEKENSALCQRLKEAEEKAREVARSLDNAPMYQAVKDENRKLLMDLGAAELALRQTQAKLFQYDEQAQYERREQPMYQVTLKPEP